MKYQDLLDFKKRIDFNLTEPEVLVKLIEEARVKGEKTQKDMVRLRELSLRISSLFEEKKLLFQESALNRIELRHKCVVGIDGSYQVVGGAGGKWYAPISVARIIFEDGFGRNPHVDIFWVGIQEIDESVDPPPDVTASIMMLSAESKAIFNWGTLNKPAFVFIDGPIVDPPVISYGEESYIKDRCEGIRKCLEKSTVIGCVKRSRDRFYIRYLEKIFSNSSEKDYLNQFLTDQHLMAYIFAHVRSKKYRGPIFTKWIDISSANKFYELYKKHGVYIACLFFQKNIMSPVLRLDVPFLEYLEENARIYEDILQVAKATNEWTYPGQDYPLPVILAHEKCNIREGCAEVLYEEIITKSRTIDPQNQIILSQLR